MMNFVFHAPTSMQVACIVTSDRGGKHCRRAFH